MKCAPIVDLQLRTFLRIRGYLYPRLSEYEGEEGHLVWWLPSAFDFSLSRCRQIDTRGGGGGLSRSCSAASPGQVGAAAARRGQRLLSGNRAENGSSMSVDLAAAAARQLLGLETPIALSGTHIGPLFAGLKHPERARIAMPRRLLSDITPPAVSHHTRHRALQNTAPCRGILFF